MRDERERKGWWVSGGERVKGEAEKKGEEEQRRERRGDAQRTMSPCETPPLEKNRTASCVRATSPNGFGKSPTAGAPCTSARKAEYSSIEGTQ